MLRVYEISKVLSTITRSGCTSSYGSAMFFELDYTATLSKLGYKRVSDVLTLSTEQGIMSVE
jgi:hypothetical protein